MSTSMETLHTGKQKDDVQSRHSELITLEKFVELASYNLYPLEKLFHATSEISHSVILDQKEIRGGPTPNPGWSMLAKATNTGVDGVWFCSTLYKGRSPDISRYGSRRFILNARDLFDAGTLFFYDTTYYFRRSPQNQYVRFVAVKRDQRGFDWCCNNLPQTNTSRSLFFCQGRDGIFSALQNNEETVRFWLEVLVLGDVSLEENRWEPEEVRNTTSTDWTNCVRGTSWIFDKILNDLALSRCSSPEVVFWNVPRLGATCINKHGNDIQSLFWELNSLEKFIGLGSYMLYPLEELFHVTSDESRFKFLKENKLCGCATPKPSWSMLAMAKANEDVNGVWFRTTLNKGVLSSSSETHKFIFPARNILDADTLLFYDTTYYFVRSPENQYVRFVAVKRHQKGFDWCYRNLPQIDTSLSLFFFQGKDGTFSVLQSNVETVELWLEVLVLGDVSLEDNHWIEDKVKKTKCTNWTSCVRGISHKLGNRLKELVRSRFASPDVSVLIKKMTDVCLR